MQWYSVQGDTFDCGATGTTQQVLMPAVDFTCYSGGLVLVHLTVRMKGPNEPIFTVRTSVLDADHHPVAGSGNLSGHWANGTTRDISMTYALTLPETSAVSEGLNFHVTGMTTPTPVSARAVVLVLPASTI